jgi:hypothetical protein
MVMTKPSLIKLGILTDTLQIDMQLSQALETGNFLMTDYLNGGVSHPLEHHSMQSAAPSRTPVMLLHGHI